jgi:hypothetical protein
VADDPDDDEPARVVVYCLRCAAREFGEQCRARRLAD